MMKQAPAYTFFGCDTHGDLPINPTMLDNLPTWFRNNTEYLITKPLTQTVYRAKRTSQTPRVGGMFLCGSLIINHNEMNRISRDIPSGVNLIAGRRPDEPSIINQAATSPGRVITRPKTRSNPISVGVRLASVASRVVARSGSTAQINLTIKRDETSQRDEKILSLVLIRVLLNATVNAQTIQPGNQRAAESQGLSRTGIAALQSLGRPATPWR